MRTNKNSLFTRLLPAILGMVLSSGAALADSLDDFATRFTPDDETLRITYRVAYRLLSFELKQLAEADLRLTGGMWSNRVTGATTPAMLLDLQVQSLERGQPEKSRASVRTHLMALATLPDVQVLAFGKNTHEWYNPTFRPRTEVHTISLYSMEAGHLEFWKTNCVTGETMTNIANMAMLEEQSRQVKPILNALRDACRGARPMLKPEDGITMKCSVAEQVVPLEITSRRDPSPADFADDSRSTMLATVSPPRDSQVQSRPFRAWIIPYKDAAETTSDPSLKAHLKKGEPEGLVALAFDYGMAVGSVRCTLTGIDIITNTPPAAVAAAKP